MGKTTISKNLKSSFTYLNYDSASDRKIISKGEWQREVELIIFDEKERQRSTLAKLSFVQLLKAKKFDAVFLLHRSFTRALICRLAGIPERFGYYTKKRGFLLTKRIAHVGKDSLHRIDYYLNIIEKAGLEVEDRYLEFFIDDKDVQFVEEFLNKKSISIIFIILFSVTTVL